MRMLTTKEIEELSLEERKSYFHKLREYCLVSKANYQLKVGQSLIKSIYPSIRNYSIILEGEENIPHDSKVIFVVNHSNSHDIFTAYEFLSMLNRKGSVMVATDCLNNITKNIFWISNATLLDRRCREESNNSIFHMSKKILEGNDCVIFGEATWNLHPYLPMQNLKLGFSKIASITEVPIIPTIMEYIEIPDLCKKESDLYRYCIIRFGKTIEIKKQEGLINQTNGIQSIMSQIRSDVWKDNNIVRSSLDDIDVDQYLNHTYIKKYKAFGFQYNSATEEKFLLSLDGNAIENEYHLSNEGIFEPGITTKKEGEQLQRSYFKK